jgi:hypothetical protein
MKDHHSKWVGKDNMGYLTTVTIHNDRLHEFKEKPLEFAKLVFEAMDEAERQNKQADVAGGYITAEHSRHADDHTLYLHYGNTLFEINGYGSNFENLIKNHPDLAKRLCKEAQLILTIAKKKISKKPYKK